MKTSTKVGVALGLALVGSYTASRTRRGTRNPPVQRTLLILPLVMFSQWWNPFNWAGKLGNLLSGSVQDVENWVENAINWAMSLYDEALSVAVGTIEDILNLVTEAIGNLTTDVTTLSAQVLGIIDSSLGTVLSDAETYAGNAVAQLFNEVSGWISDVKTWALDAINAAVSAYNVVVTDIVNPVVSWVANAESWLAGHLAESFADFATDVDNLVDDAVAGVEAGFDVISNLVLGEIITVVHAVEAMWDWVLWFGEHAIEDILDLPSEIEAFGTYSFGRSLVDALAGEGDWAEQVWTEFLGS